MQIKMEDPAAMKPTHRQGNGSQGLGNHLGVGSIVPPKEILEGICRKNRLSNQDAKRLIFPGTAGPGDRLDYRNGAGAGNLKIFKTG